MHLYSSLVSSDPLHILPPIIFFLDYSRASPQTLSLEECCLKWKDLGTQVYTRIVFGPFGLHASRSVGGWDTMQARCQDLGAA